MHESTSLDLILHGLQTDGRTAFKGHVEIVFAELLFTLEHAQHRATDHIRFPSEDISFLAMNVAIVRNNWLGDFPRGFLYSIPNNMCMVDIEKRC